MQQTIPTARRALKPTFCDISETCVLVFEKDVLLTKLKSVELSKFSTDHTETIQEKLPPPKDKVGFPTLNQFCTCR